MEKKKYKLCIEVLRRFRKAGLLSHIIIIGSWSIYFYKYYFKSKSYSTFIRTTDIDFLIPTPFKFDKEVDLYQLIEDLGFLEEFKGEKGYIKLKHPDLTVEFLVPERGRGYNKPYEIPQLKINAQPLRYLDFLVENTVIVKFNNLNLKLPHPAVYVLHKFVIFKRRKKIDKSDRDIEGALRVFLELFKNNKQNEIKEFFSKMHKSWQKTVLKNLKSIGEFEIIDILE